MSNCNKVSCVLGEHLGGGNKCVFKLPWHVCAGGGHGERAGQRVLGRAALQSDYASRVSQH